MRYRRSLGRACLLAAALGACEGGGGGPARGFGSRQLLSIRDQTIELWGQRSDLANAFIFLTRDDVGAMTYFALDLSDGRLETLGPSLPDFRPPEPKAPTGTAARYRCSHVTTSAGTRFTIIDGETGAMTVIEGLVYTECPTADDPTIAVWRRDGAGMLTLLTGRYDALEPQALSGLLVIEVVFRVERGFLVAAAVLDETLARGLYLLDPSTGEHTVVIPPELADAAWAPGADATTTLRSTSISPPGQVPAYWTTVRTIGGHFVYGRLMIDGSTMLFARPSSLEPARELALFRLDPTTAWLELRDPFPDRPLTGSTLGAAPVQPVTSHAAWSREVGGGMSILTVWDDRGERLVSCPVPQGLGVLTGALMSSRRKLAFGPAAAFSGDPIPTSLTLVAPDAAAAGDVAGACRVLAAGGVVSSQTSPDGETLVWLVAGDGAERELWTATGDGAPRKLGAGMIDQPYFSGAAQVHFRLGTDLVWLDPHDDPVRLHYVAEKVFGFPSGGGGSWFIAGYGFSEQDSTGTLGLVRWGDGAKRPVSGAVAAYRVLEPVAPFTVVYLVRGRTPSPQDGFWVATLTADDLR